MLGRSPVFSVVNSARTEFGPFKSFRETMAGQEGFEPPTPGFGDRCSSRTELLSYLRLGLGLPGFLVNRVLPATGAELLPLHAVGVLAFVLRIRVVPLLAFAASERDQIAHGPPPSTR